MNWLELRDQLKPLVVSVTGQFYKDQSQQIAGEMVSCIRSGREFPFSKYSMTPDCRPGIVALVAGARAAIVAAKAG